MSTVELASLLQSTNLLGYTGSQGQDGSAGIVSSNTAPENTSLLWYDTQGQGQSGYTGSQGVLGSAGYTGSQGDIGYTGSQGDIGYTGSQGTPGTFASFYANISSLPPSADIGTLAFVSDNSSIYAFNGSEWIDTNPNTRNFFYILQTNSFTGPITGNVGFAPTRTIQLQSLEANVATNTSTTIVLTVRKNNDTLQQFSLTGGQLGLVSDFSNNSVTTSDTIYLDITSGSGTDLVARFNYK